MRCYVFLSDEFHSRDLSINNINLLYIPHCRLNHTAPGFYMVEHQLVEIVLIIAQALANGLILLMHCLVVTIFIVLIIILQLLLLFCCCQLWFTMNFIISYKQYIGKTVYGIGY